MDKVIPPPKAPEEIFPEEVWPIIFDKLESPIDKANCFRTCNLFRHLLEKERKTFLMPEVFVVLCKYLFFGEAKKTDEESYDTNTKDANLNPVLATRAVCSSWKFAVDTFLQNHPFYYDIGVDLKPVEQYKYKSGDTHPNPLGPYKFIHPHHYGGYPRVSEVEKFLAKEFPADSNPFINRCVTYKEQDYWGDIDHESYRLLIRFRQAFINLLRLYGSHIWHAEFTIDTIYANADSINSKIENVYNAIHQYFCLMPNLRTLKIYFASTCNGFYPADEATWEGLVMTHPLSKFEHLTTLRMIDVPTAIEKRFIVDNSHVQSLYFDTHRTCPKGCLPGHLLNIKMNNLQQFAVRLIDKKQFYTLRFVSWPAIKAIKICGRFDEFDGLFRAISESSFGETIKTLIVSPACVTGWECVSPDMVLTAKLELPQLETFKIVVPAMQDRFDNVDFLLPGCPSLKHLEVEMHAPLNVVRSKATCSRKNKKNKVWKRKPLSVIKFVQYANYKSLPESNIWELLPRLKRVQILWKGNKGGMTCSPIHEESHKFTREQYKAFQKNKGNIIEQLVLFNF